MRITYRGVDRRGVGCVGTVHVGVADFVETNYKARWQWLSVEADGRIVGEIVPDPSDESRRTWWACAEASA